MIKKFKKKTKNFKPRVNRTFPGNLLRLADHHRENVHLHLLVHSFPCSGQMTFPP